MGDEMLEEAQAGFWGQGILRGFVLIGRFVTAHPIVVYMMNG